MRKLYVLSILGSLGIGACSSEDDGSTPPAATGGVAPTGGTAGKAPSTGGTLATGGTIATGGTLATGGTVATGGVSGGGAKATGGGAGKSSGGSSGSGAGGSNGGTLGGGGSGGASAGAGGVTLGGGGAGGAGGGSAGKGGNGGSAGSMGGAAGGGAGGGTGATFKAVTTILDNKCMPCHGMAGHVMLKSGGDLHSRLMNAPSPAENAACANVKLVVPGMPESSYLYQAVRPNGTRMGCSDRMPKGCQDGEMGSKGGCLSADEIETIRSWIAGGAPM